MKTKKTTNISKLKALSAYSATAAAILASGQANAQIVYTDLDPDQSLEALGDGTGGGFIHLDLDDDAAMDLRIMVKGIYNASWDTSMMVSAHFDIINDDFEIKADYWANSVCCLGMYAYRSWSGNVLNLENNYNIGATGLWNSEQNLDLFVSIYGGNDYAGTFGLWGDAEISDRYVGFRKQSGSDFQYGWIRLSTTHSIFDGVDPASISYSVTVLDYALNLTLNDPILAAEGMPCNPPVPIGTVNITTTTAKAKWNEIVNSDEYNLFYRQVGAGTWTKKHVTNPVKKITGLLCNTSYEWKIRTVCDDENSAFSAIQTFTTSACKMEGEDIINDEINIYPNPVTNILFVETNKNSDLEFEIFDITGKLMKSFLSVADNSLMPIDIAELPSGMYLLHISGNSGTDIIKFVKQ